MTANYMTKKSYERLSGAARRLKEVEIPRVSREKLQASRQGDLNENAEYAAAKDKLDLLHARLAQLGAQLAGAQFIEDLPVPGDIVSIGTRVRILDLESGEEEEYCILGPADADLENGIISYQSPLAKGMISRRAGNEVEVATPAGARKFRILSVKKHFSSQ